MAAPIPSRATQDFVPIREIRDDTVVLKDGSLRAVLLTSSLNFGLKSEDEQIALIGQFQNFLNALDFTVQIFIQSRRLDIRPYIALLEGRFREQVNELMKIQTQEYIQFIKNFTESTEIMSKSFFVVVPYTPAIFGAGKGSGLRALLPSRKKSKTITSDRQSFEEQQIQLEQRIHVVEQGLARMGVRSVRLGTEEAIELFYKLFNPGELEKPIPLR